MGNFDPNINNFYFGAVFSLMGCLGIITTGKAPEIALGYELFGFVIAAFLGFLVQSSMVMSLRYEYPPIVTLIESLNVVYSVFFDVVVLHIPMSLLSIIGSTIIVVSFTYLMLN